MKIDTDKIFEEWWKEEQESYQPLNSYRKMVKAGWDACLRKLPKEDEENE